MLSQLRRPAPRERNRRPSPATHSTRTPRSHRRRIPLLTRQRQLSLQLNLPTHPMAIFLRPLRRRSRLRRKCPTSCLRLPAMTFRTLNPSRRARWHRRGRRRLRRDRDPFSRRPRRRGPRRLALRRVPCRSDRRLRRRAAGAIDTARGSYSLPHRQTNLRHHLRQPSRHPPSPRRCHTTKDRTAKSVNRSASTISTVAKVAKGARRASKRSVIPAIIGIITVRRRTTATCRAAPGQPSIT